MDWYQNIEPEIREIVRALRNNGINTTCSCGHGLWVQCESADPETEYNTIYNVLIGMGYKNFRLYFSYVCAEGHWSKHLEIMLAKNGQYYCRWEDNTDFEIT